MKVKPVKLLNSAILLGATLAFGIGVQAQTSTAASAPAAKAVVPSEFTNGEVRKVDKEGKKVTLKHEEIKNLGMPPMAMVFEVKDASVLDKFKAGDKVLFKCVWEAGKYIVIDIQPAK
jgi:Cu(I)/Ag(I) efflux system periplasmic protein CusF